MGRSRREIRFQSQELTLQQRNVNSSFAMPSARYEIVATHTKTETVFDLTQTSELSGMHPEMILEFVRADLIHVLSSGPGDAPLFDYPALARLRQIEHFRQRENLNLRTVRYIVHLLDRLESADQELRDLREQLR